MNLQAYLDRIGYNGALNPTAETLRGIQRAHLLAIPYENLDIHLGRPLTLDLAQAYDKIVVQGRGGWCFEMNGLLGWALEEVGFSVKRLAGANRRGPGGSRIVGPHLVLRIDLDGEIWIVDAGFGDGPIEPFPAREADIRHGQFHYRFAPGEDGWWRLTNHPHGMAPCFEIDLTYSGERLLAEKCAELQTDPASPFVQNAVVLRHLPQGQIKLIGQRLIRLEGGERHERLVADADDYVNTLAELFDLTMLEAATLWPSIRARHQGLFELKSE